MMINETRILNEFIELVSVPCPSKDEKAEADLLVQKLQAMGLPRLSNQNPYPLAVVL